MNIEKSLVKRKRGKKTDPNYDDENYSTERSDFIIDDYACYSDEKIQLGAQIPLRKSRDFERYQRGCYNNTTGRNNSNGSRYYPENVPIERYPELDVVYYEDIDQNVDVEPANKNITRQYKRECYECEDPNVYRNLNSRYISEYDSNLRKIPNKNQPYQYNNKNHYNGTSSSNTTSEESMGPMHSKKLYLSTEEPGEIQNENPFNGFNLPISMTSTFELTQEVLQMQNAPKPISTNDFVDRTNKKKEFMELYPLQVGRPYFVESVSKVEHTKIQVFHDNNNCQQPVEIPHIKSKTCCQNTKAANYVGGSPFLYGSSESMESADIIPVSSYRTPERFPVTQKETSSPRTLRNKDEQASYDENNLRVFEPTQQNKLKKETFTRKDCNLPIPQRFVQCPDKYGRGVKLEPLINGDLFLTNAPIVRVVDENIFNRLPNQAFESQISSSKDVHQYQRYPENLNGYLQSEGLKTYYARANVGKSRTDEDNYTSKVNCGACDVNKTMVKTPIDSSRRIPNKQPTQNMQGIRNQLGNLFPQKDESLIDYDQEAEQLLYPQYMNQPQSKTQYGPKGFNANYKEPLKIPANQTQKDFKKPDMNYRVEVTSTETRPIRLGEQEVFKFLKTGAENCACDVNKTPVKTPIDSSWAFPSALLTDKQRFTNPYERRINTKRTVKEGSLYSKPQTKIYKKDQRGPPKPLKSDKVFNNKITCPAKKKAATKAAATSSMLAYENKPADKIANYGMKRPLESKATGSTLKQVCPTRNDSFNRNNFEKITEEKQADLILKIPSEESKKTDVMEPQNIELNKLTIEEMEKAFLKDLEKQGIFPVTLKEAKWVMEIYLEDSQAAEKPTDRKSKLICIDKMPKGIKELIPLNYKVGKDFDLTFDENSSGICSCDPKTVMKNEIIDFPWEFSSALLSENGRFRIPYGKSLNGTQLYYRPHINIYKNDQLVHPKETGFIIPQKEQLDRISLEDVEKAFLKDLAKQDIFPADEKVAKWVIKLSLQDTQTSEKPRDVLSKFILVDKIPKEINELISQSSRKDVDNDPTSHKDSSGKVSCSCDLNKIIVKNSVDPPWVFPAAIFFEKKCFTVPHEGMDCQKGRLKCGPMYIRPHIEIDKYDQKTRSKIIEPETIKEKEKYSLKKKDTIEKTPEVSMLADDHKRDSFYKHEIDKKVPSKKQSDEKPLPISTLKSVDSKSEILKSKEAKNIIFQRGVITKLFEEETSIGNKIEPTLLNLKRFETFEVEAKVKILKYERAICTIFYFHEARQAINYSEESSRLIESTYCLEKLETELRVKPQEDLKKIVPAVKIPLQEKILDKIIYEKATIKKISLIPENYSKFKEKRNYTSIKKIKKEKPKFCCKTESGTSESIGKHKRPIFHLKEKDDKDLKTTQHKAEPKLELFHAVIIKSKTILQKANILDKIKKPLFKRVDSFYIHEEHKQIVPEPKQKSIDKIKTKPIYKLAKKTKIPLEKPEYIKKYIYYTYKRVDSFYQFEKKESGEPHILLKEQPLSASMTKNRIRDEMHQEKEIKVINYERIIKSKLPTQTPDSNTEFKNLDYEKGGRKANKVDSFYKYEAPKKKSKMEPVKFENVTRIKIPKEKPIVKIKKQEPLWFDSEYIFQRKSVLKPTDRSKFQWRILHKRKDIQKPEFGVEFDEPDNVWINYFVEYERVTYDNKYIEEILRRPNALLPV